MSFLLAPTLLTLATALSAPAPQLQSQALLDALRESSGVPGLGAAVWQQGRLVWQGSSGLRDLAQQLPVQADTRFRLASVSKLFAATAAAQLVQQGQLDPEAPVQPLLGEALPPDWPPLSSAQLAAHSAGVPHYQAQDSGRGHQAHASAREATATHLQARQLVGAPGARFHYSSWGYTVLSAVVEARSGLNYLDFLARHTTPGLAIGVDRSDDAQDRTMSRPYTLTPQGPQPAAPHDYSYTWGGGGLAATPGALAEWGGRVLQGRVVDAATRDWMWTPQRLNSGEPSGERDFQMGFGWRLGQDLEGQALRHHAGVTSGARSVLLLWPEQQLSVSLLSNALWTSAIERTAELLSAPFRPLPKDLVAADCPTGHTRFQAELQDEAFEGRLRFVRVAGHCQGELELPEALATRLHAPPQPRRERLRVLALAPGLARAALVSPIGLLEWRAIGQDKAQVLLPGQRLLKLRLQA
ncbi:serine hydrolase domain-containing protein [Inhella proteolytica]|uniref:Beta-lactamase family protein n=1 Tax=Inhella proteolytica TaxID=2795029 RepID=A0A931J5H4_9BURK|nr:serine hydrolase domain-containing protein [Inhella proteolytica]MBH9577227.1 beta-lactamase family protein [Inhella proteolytica]